MAIRMCAVYDDPLTRGSLEGFATILSAKPAGVYDGFILAHCRVRFGKGEKPVIRQILTNVCYEDAQEGDGIVYLHKTGKWSLCTSA